VGEGSGQCEVEFGGEGERLAQSPTEVEVHSWIDSKANSATDTNGED